MNHKQQNAVTGDWLYFSEKECGVRDIYDMLKDRHEIEIWEDAGVLEIQLGDGSMDMEEGAIHPKDEVTGAFAAEHGFVSVFLVTFKAEEYDMAKKVMEEVLQKAGGAFCGDTEDFTPYLTANV